MKTYKSVLVTLLMSVCPSIALAAGTPGLDVNDVSILFPLDAKGIPTVGLKLGSPTLSGQPLLQEVMFSKQIIPFALTKQITPVSNYSQWQIVGLRYDPCFPALPADGDLSKCIRQLRLIAQPNEGSAGPSDTAMHLLYKIGQGAPQAKDPVIAQLRVIQAASAAIHAPTVGVPLDVHPGLVAEAAAKGINKTPVADAVRKLVFDNVGASKLMEITYMGTQGGDPWIFIGGTVENIGAGDKHVIQQQIWKAHEIPISGGNSQSMFAGSQLTPTHAAIEKAMNFFSGGDAGQKNAANDLHTIENPEKSNPTALDCVSCHMSSQKIVTLLVPFSGHANVFKNPAGVTGFVELPHHQSISYNTRNFGYFFTSPSIASLTANSSASVADLANRTQGWKNPSPLDCSRPEVRQCFADKARGTAKQCLVEPLCTKRANF